MKLCGPPLVGVREPCLLEMRVERGEGILPLPHHHDPDQGEHPDRDERRAEDPRQPPHQPSSAVLMESPER